VRELLALHVDLSPSEFVAEALIEALSKAKEVADKRFLLLQGELSRPMLKENLLRLQARKVSDVHIYQTKPAADLPEQLIDTLNARQVHWITFTSASTASNLARLLGANYLSLLQGVKIASIGPITSARLRELQLTPTIEAQRHDIHGLTDAILQAHSR